MTDAIIIKQTIDDFLSQKIHKAIEQKQKQAKGNFSEDDKQKIQDEYKIVAWLDKVAENTHKVFFKCLSCCQADTFKQSGNEFTRCQPI